MLPITFVSGDDTFPFRVHLAAFFESDVVVNHNNRSACASAHEAPVVVGENHSRDVCNLKRVLEALCFGPSRCADVVKRHAYSPFADSRIGCALETQMAAKRSSDGCVAYDTGAESRHCAISVLCLVSFATATIPGPRRRALPQREGMR